jgi:hypothetical protein
MPSTATPTSAINMRPPPFCVQPTTHRAAPKKQRINWTYEMEEAIVNGLVEAVRKGLRADSS